MQCAAILIPLSLAERFVGVIALLCQAVAAHGSRNPAARPLILPAWARLRRLCTRFVALASAVEAGRLASPRQRTDAARRLTAPQPVRLPGEFGWLLRLAPHVDTRIARSQVEHWLTDPAVTELVEVAPRAGRILRPLCRMLAIELPPALRLPKRPRVRRGLPPAAAVAVAVATVPTAGPAPDASRSVPSWLRLPSSPPLPGLPRAGGSRAFLGTEPDPSPD